MDKQITCSEHELREAIKAEVAEVLRHQPESDQWLAEWQTGQIVGGVILRLSRMGTGATTLTEFVRKQRKLEELRGALASSNGDPNVAMKKLIEAGNLSGAAVLSTSIEAVMATIGRIWRSV